MTIITGPPVGCGRSSAHRGRQRPPHGAKRFWYVWAAAALRRGRVSNAVVAATAAALEALSTTGSSSFVRAGADAVRHTIRGAAGNQVAWRVSTHAVELRPGGERLGRERVEDPKQLSAAIRRCKRAMADGRPYLLDIVIERRFAGADSDWYDFFSVARDLPRQS